MNSGEQLNWDKEMQERQAMAAENLAESIDNVNQLVDMGMVLEYDETVLARPIFRDGMDFVAYYMEELRDMIKRLSFRMGRADLHEEVFSDAVIGWANHAFNKFDPSRNDDIKGWMFSQCQLYARKWFERYRNKAGVAANPRRYAELEAGDECGQNTIDRGQFAALLRKIELDSIANYRREISAQLDTDTAIHLLGFLSDTEERLVRMHCCYSQTFDEIAERIGGAPSTLRVAYNAAIAKLKRLACDDGKGG